MDNTLSFSYYYNNHNKIEQVSDLNEILINPTLTKVEKEELLALRENIVKRKTWKDMTWDFLSEIEFKNDEKEIIVENTKVDSGTIERSYIWHFISSSWLILLVMIVMPFIALWGQDGDIGFTIGIMLLIEGFLYSLAWVFAKSLSYIPIILGSPVYNYVLNGVICFVAFLAFSLLTNIRKL